MEPQRLRKINQEPTNGNFGNRICRKVRILKIRGLTVKRVLDNNRDQSHQFLLVSIMVFFMFLTLPKASRQNSRATRV